ncbi:hypothetical protein [Streptomyces turgidiscabies]|uniref:Secreted protein n=1 Tax=Streptomyces turgidiscabies TaxID=85558 RepID=A0ABU0RT30_9ACTN|nr:hypothetical protein [Streptomyces turgidiscabies]MDQ0935154.1 hypothetical protein [Streptomyces turgidiscabies]
MHWMRMATLAALTVGGLTSPYCGVAIADGPGASATGGSGAGSLFQQNTAQGHRQNNNCANPNDSDIVLTGGRTDSGCTAKDASHTKHSLLEDGDAHAEGGSSAGGLVQQNTAQSGRQNNNCANPNGSTVIASEGGQTGSGCTAEDASHTKHSLLEDGDAHAEGGSSAGANAFQQNTAQSGRQNNNCNNPNGSAVVLTGGRTDSGCTAKDASHTKHSRVEGGDAHAEGGSSAGGLVQQNTAQSGRQNNNCANPNSSAVFMSEGGRTGSGCTAKDASHAEHSLVEGGDAHAEGGSSAGDLVQQNTAQSGRQNNNCDNPNNSVITTTASRAETDCETVDHSKNVGTVEISDGAEAKGGSSALGLFQQNTAQSGRQNNNCGNPNDLTLTATGSSTQTQCVAVDQSTNIGTVYR